MRGRCLFVRATFAWIKHWFCSGAIRLGLGEDRFGVI